MATPEELAAAEAAKAAQEAEAAKVAAEAKAKADEEAKKKAAEDEAFDKDRAMATIKKLRDIEDQAKKDKKELDALKAEAQKRADAELSETERLKKQATELAEKNAKLESDLWRSKAISATGLPDTFSDRLKGSTEAEILADAQELAKILPAQKVAPRLQATNPANATQNETDAQQRERLFGKTGSVFDRAAIEAGGGGVVWPTPKQ